VTDADVKTYYNAHKDTYSQKESRDVRHILVNSKKLADQLETQLKNGGDFAKLAKKYSKDPGSASQGGKLTVSKGQTVAPFDKVAFTLKTNEISTPVHTTYGWHIIQALSAVKPAKVTPLADVKTSIQQQLLQTKKTDAMTKWVDDLKKTYAKQISYQTGYAPLATSTGTTPATTTTG
jgi:foldase protein PrsA